MAAAEISALQARIARRRSIVILSTCCALGAACFWFQYQQSCLSDVLGLSPFAIDVVARCVGIVLPRTYFELPQIYDHMGYIFYSNAVLLLAFTSAGGVVCCILNIFSQNRYDVLEGLPFPRYYLPYLPVVFSLFYRPADFQSRGIYLNVVDDTAFYFVRECLWISVGYFFAAGILGHWATKVREIAKGHR